MSTSCANPMIAACRTQRDRRTKETHLSLVVVVRCTLSLQYTKSRRASSEKRNSPYIVPHLLSPADRHCTAKGTSHLHHTVRRHQRRQGRPLRRVQPRILPCRRRRRLTAAPGAPNMPRPRTARYPSFTQGVKNMLHRQLVHPDHRTGRTDHHLVVNLGDPCSPVRSFR